MSKKRFTDGLESLFGYSEGGNLPEESPLLAETEIKIETKPASAKKKRGRTGKNFISDLDSLFSETVETGNVVEETPIADDKPVGAGHKRKNRRPVSGLDALIRRTLESGEAEVSYDKRKRVTFVFEKSKVDKLKRIAKSQKVYLKDILGNIVQDYLKKYEEQQAGLKN